MPSKCNNKSISKLLNQLISSYRIPFSRDCYINIYHRCSQARGPQEERPDPLVDPAEPICFGQISYMWAMSLLHSEYVF